MMRALKSSTILVMVTTISLLVTMFNAGTVLATWPYPDYASFITSFKALAVSHPQSVSYQSIGKTVLGQDILMFKIGNPAGGVVLFDGAIHGYESEGSQLLYYYADWLLTSNDSLAQHILANLCTLIVPVVNVDDYSLNRTNAHGVDLNRNFETNWQYDGSTDPISETYRGPSPLSEPESQALERVFQTYKPNAYVNLHDGGGEMLYGSSYDNSTYINAVLVEISSMSSQRGVTPYSLNSIISFGGAAITDAVTKGGASISLLLELGNATRTLSEVNSLVLPRFIPIAAVLSQESEHSIQPVQNGTLFSDSFESGSFGSWDGTSVTAGETMAVSSTLSRDGSHSAFFIADGNQTSGAAYVFKDLQPQTNVYERGYIMPTIFSQTGSYSRFYFAAFAASGQTIAMAGCLKNGTTTSWRLAALVGTNWATVDSAADGFQRLWHSFELQWGQGVTDGYARLYIDNVLIASISQANTTAYGPVNSVQIGIAMSGNARTSFYLDYLQTSNVSLGPLPIPADINRDGVVNMLDFVVFAHAYGATPGAANWDPRCDLRGELKVDLQDLIQFASCYGERMPSSFVYD